MTKSNTDENVASHADHLKDIVIREGAPYLVGDVCRACGEIQFPKRAHCTACGVNSSRITEHIFDGETTVESYTEIHTPHSRFDPPYVVGYVRLSPGNIRVFTPFFDTDVDDVSIGDSVTVSTARLTGDEDFEWGVKVTR